MEKSNISNFELIKNIINNLDFNYDEQTAQIKEKLSDIWIEAVGKKISEMSKVYDFSSDNMLEIVCSDSYVANELYFVKEKLTNIMNEKIQKTGIKIKDIKFDYKKWKEQK